MKLTDKEEISKWAYYQCLNGNDTQEMRDLITDSNWAYSYCRDVKDRKEIWSKIKCSYWAHCYCKFVKDKPEVRKLWDKRFKKEQR